MFLIGSDINDEYLVTTVGHLLLRILRMWLVCQLLINRHQVGEGNLEREKEYYFKTYLLRRTQKMHAHFWLKMSYLSVIENSFISFHHYICRFQLKAPFFGVHNWMLLYVCACSCYADDLQKKRTNIRIHLKKKNHLYALISCHISLIGNINDNTEKIDESCSLKTGQIWARVNNPARVSVTIWLTDLAMEGRPHSVLSSLVLCKRPCESTVLSRTSTPKTLGFMGLGYFCMAALVTVSHGWLCDKKTQQQSSVNTTNY